MTHKAKKNTNDTPIIINKEVPTKAGNQDIDAIENSNTIKPTKTITPTPDDILDGFTLLIADGKALKLSSKTQNHVFYQLAVKDEDNSLHLRMSGNEGGGLHTKLWVSLNDIITLLDEQKDKAIKSTLLRPVFQGGSANNCGFMAAVLRSSQIGLLTQSEQSVFDHRLSSEYELNKESLLNMAK